MGLFISLVVNSICLWILDALFTNITFNSTSALIVTALALVIVNAVLKPILKILSLPLTILTFGLFSFVVNALVLMAAFGMSSGSHIEGFGTALFAAIVLAIINPIISNLFYKKS
jgi:putative membrane protein